VSADTKPVLVVLFRDFEAFAPEVMIASSKAIATTTATSALLPSAGRMLIRRPRRHNGRVVS